MRPHRAGGFDRVDVRECDNRRKGSQMASEGRFRRGLVLTRKSASLVRRNPRLAAFPLISIAVLGLGAVLLFGVAFSAGRAEHSRWPFFLVGAVASYPMTAIAVYCNVAFVAMAADVLDGNDAR